MSFNCEANSNCTITDWKRLWQLVSGIHYAPSENTVKETLLDVSKELQDGILQFKTSSSSSKTLENILKEKKQEKLLSFTNKLQQLLDLESNQCWEILCYYLTNEYRGTASSLTSLTSTESNMIKLLDDIWGYYTLVRMIVLKVVKNMLEFYENTLNPYHNEYKIILNQITMEKLKKSYLNQFEYLVKESPPIKLTPAEFTNYQNKLIDWNERNCRETIEVLHILLLIINYCGVTCDEMKKIINCFERHSFGRQYNFLNESNEIHSELKIRIVYCEVVLFLRCIDVTQSNVDTAWINEVITGLDKNILSLYSCSYPEYGPFLLSWMLLNFRVLEESEDILSARKYRQFGGKAVQLQVFIYLKEIVAHKMFNDGTMISKIIRKTIYNLLSHLCELFDENRSVSQHYGVYELMGELLSTTEIAREFCQNEDSGLRSMYNTALENFPIDFINLSQISYALVKAGEIQFVKEQLEELPIYTELYDNVRIKLQSANGTDDDEYILHKSLIPFRGIDYTIPAGTTAAIMQQSNGCFIHFRININYYNVLYNEINVLLLEAIQYTELDENRLKRVNAGLQLLSLIIEKINSPSEIIVEMVHPTEMCIDLLNKFKNFQKPPLELLANCLNVCAALLPLFKNEIFSRIINLNICPCINNETLDFKKYAHGMSFDSSLVGNYLINIEHKEEKYEFLVAYLNFLQKYLTVNAEDKTSHNRLFLMEIPGLIFLLREVFPHIHSWRFRKVDDRNQIYKATMNYICDILDIVTTTGKYDEINAKNILRDISVYSLLNLDNGIVLLKFIANGNPFLQSSMEMESNWLTTSPTGIIRLVRQSMRILMHLLRLKTTIFESSKLSPLETLIYTQPKQRDTLRIIPVVTSYMNNIFDQSLSILSCRLLRRIAIEFKMSLLACLDMEPDQIRLVFLQRLPDDLESDNLKIAILEFVEACIEKQPGLTQAFFKINFEQEKRLFAPKEKESNIGDSIITFMKIYLASVAERPNIIECPLPSRIMSIFHALWKNNMQSLLDDLTKKSDFWSSLCNPLFVETYKTDIKVYSQILNVLGLEIFCCRPKQKLDINLQKVLDKFFEQKQFEKWLKYVFDLPKISNEQIIIEETSEWLSRLQSFKDFTVILLKKNIQGLEIPTESKKMLAIKCLEVLVERAEYIDDLRPFIILSELYLIVLFSFKHTYTNTADEDLHMLKQMTKLLSSVSICYEDLHVRAKESCLSITIKITGLLAGELIKNSNIALNFLYPIVGIICFELSQLDRTVKDEIIQKKSKESAGPSKESQKQQRNISLILSLNLLKIVASTFHNEGSSNWNAPFITNRVFNRLLSCLHGILQLSSKQKLTIELLDVLIVFAKGNCSNEFLHCDIGDYLWLKLLPPKELLQTPYLIQSQQHQQSWTAQQWWPIYSRGIELLTILLQKYKYQFLKDSLLFVGIHEEFLADSMLLAKQSLESNATVLIKNTVHFIGELVEFQREWRLEHSQSLFNLMRCIQMLLGHCISLFNQQRNLKRLMSGLRTQMDPVKELASDCFIDDVINSMNDLTEIISLCAKCLLQFSPSLLHLICEPQFLACNWEPLFEIQFGPPKLNDNNSQLTFGAVLSIVGIFTKSMSLQGYSFHEIPLNSIPNKSNDEPDTNIDYCTSTHESAPAVGSRANYSKSLSVASVTSLSSTTAPSNEILANLDGELCQLALENILTLAASQSLLALKNFNLSNREKQMIRREISTELITYHEFVRKKVLNDIREYRDMWHRKKRGLTIMKLNANEDVGENSGIRQSDSYKRKDSLRVNVVRGLHLGRRKNPTTPQPGPSKEAFDMTQDLSPITKSTQKKSYLNTLSAIASTPNLPSSSKRRNVDENNSEKMFDAVDYYSEDNEEIQFFEPEEPTYSPLSYISFVEEDYLHFLSNLFTVICQSD